MGGIRNLRHRHHDRGAGHSLVHLRGLGDQSCSRPRYSSYTDAAAGQGLEQGVARPLGVAQEPVPVLAEVPEPVRPLSVAQEPVPVLGRVQAGERALGRVSETE